jgi:hypothetical protein
MPLTPRIEAAEATSLSDFAARVSATRAADAIVFDASGRLLTAAHVDPASGSATYSVQITLRPDALQLEARSTADARLVVPIVCMQSEPVERFGPRQVRVHRERGRLVLESAADTEFAPVPEARVFNLVPGFQCAPIVLPLAPGRTASLSLRAET